MIRVLVAEDSRAAQDLLVALLESDPGIRVVGRASGGAEAVELAERLKPDLITMDIQMPGMDGFEATRQIMARAPAPIIIVSSTARKSDVELSLRATQLGAVMVLPKPGGPGSPGFDEAGAELVAMARAMAQVKVVRRWSLHVDGQAPAAPVDPRPARGLPVRLVAMAASTGGPAALQQILSGMRGCAVPVLVVQHIARGFVGPLVEWLNATTPLRVKLAAAGERAIPGTVYVGPDERHLGVAPEGTLLLTDGPPVSGFRPSASALFESVGRAYGPAAAAVILTGMGNDGVSGLRSARAAGVRVIAQDEQSSVVYGMPAEAVSAGLADEILPLGQIGARLVGLAG